jgi:phosphoglycerate dehydrogenase-like enzyme
MPLSVHYPDAPDQKHIDLLKSLLLPDIHLTTGSDLPANPGYHILVDGRPSPEQLQVSPHLHTVIIPWAGIPREMNEILAGYPDIALHKLHHNAVTTAELAFALLLSAAKFIVPMDRSLRSGDWSPRYQTSPALLLSGKTALILGYGSIGRELARMCKGLGLTILATRRTPTAGKDEYADEIHPDTTLPDLLPRAKALLICLPHTPETEGLIGPEELALLPQPAVLVNIGRGKIIQEAALYDALKNRSLHAAGLDVWYNYPKGDEARTNTPPANYPFHELDNVVMSPHRGGDTLETDRLRMDHLARLLNAAVQGESVPNQVNLDRGY